MPNTTPEGASRRTTRSRLLTRRAIDGAVNNNLLVVMILVLATVLLAIGPELFVADSWLTLVSGREITHHGLPHHETLTTIPLGRTWTDQQWLGQLVFYGLDRLGGLGLMVLFHSLMVSGALAITVIASRVRGASSRMTLVVAVICLLVAPWSWQLRAQSIALPLFALTLALAATDPRLAARRTFLVFPTLVLWANVHGSVVLGAALVSFAGALGLLELILRRSGEAEAVPPWHPALFLVAPWACVLASPYGTDLIAYYRLLLVDSPVSKTISEWKAPQPHGYLLIFFAVAAATVVIAIWQRRRLSRYDLGVLALTLAGAWRSGRGIVWFSIAVAMLLPLALDGVVRPSLSSPVHRRLAYGLTGAFAAILAATAVITLARGDSWYEQGWPARAARATARATLASGVQGAVWPSDKFADWLLWKEPSLRGRVAWDVRFELLTDAEIHSVVVFKHHRPGWRGRVRGYPVLVLDPRTSPATVRALRNEPGTHVLFANSEVVVLTRSTP